MAGNPVTGFIALVEQYSGEPPAGLHKKRIQMLADLGYLPPEMLLVHNKSAMVTALQRFRQEWHSRFESLSGKLLTDDDQRLEALLDLDNTTGVRKMPAIGEVSLVTRMLHYRLKLYGLYDGRVSAPWGAGGITALEQLASYTGLTISETIALSGNLDGLTRFILKASAYRLPVLIVEAKRDNSEKVPEYSGKFRRTLKRELKDYPEAFSRLDKEMFYRRDKKVNIRAVEAARKNPLHRFLWHLVQLQLWQSAGYFGLIDGLGGPVTLGGLLTIRKMYALAGYKDVDDRLLLARITSDYVLFNAWSLLSTLSSDDSGPAAHQVVERLETDYVNASEAERTGFENLFISAGESSQSIRSDTEEPEYSFGAIRRVLLNGRLLLRKIARFAQHLFKWIIRKIKELHSMIQRILTTIWADLRQAAKYFLTGMKFLAGRLTYVSKNGNHQALTRFDTDKDVVTLFNSSDPELVALHSKKMLRLSRSMSFSLEVVRLFWQMARDLWMTTIPLTWPVIAFRLFRVWQQIYKKYQLIINF
ncbi:MAG: hypothetical protein Kow00127_17460 [Bacteroidales bacterium]